MRAATDRMRRSLFLIPALALALVLGRPAVASAGLQPPLDRLSWLLGTWSCSSAGSANAIAYVQTFAAAGAGNAIDQGYVLLKVPVTGTIRYSGNQFVYSSQTKAQGAVVAQHMTAPSSRVTIQQFDFSGTVTQGKNTERERWAGKQVGLSTYVDRAFAFANGGWQPILEVKCVRK